MIGTEVREERGVRHLLNARPKRLGLLLLGVHCPHGDRGILKGGKSITVRSIPIKHQVTGWVLPACHLNTRERLKLRPGTGVALAPERRAVFPASPVAALRPGQRGIAAVHFTGKRVDYDDIKLRPRAFHVTVAFRHFGNRGETGERWRR